MAPGKSGFYAAWSLNSDPLPHEYMPLVTRGAGWSRVTHCNLSPLPLENQLQRAQAAVVFGAYGHAGTAGLVGICLFINLEERSAICQGW